MSSTVETRNFDGERGRHSLELVSSPPTAQPLADERRLVLIPGMHRSGTSAVASTLIANGGWAGSEDELIGPAQANVAGFFERRDLVDLHDMWLSRLGATWDAPPAHFAERGEAAPIDEADSYLRVLLGRRPAGTGLVLKDPRMALFLREWLAVEPDAVVVLPVRHPVEVGQSLWRRDKIPVGHAIAIWHKYTAEAVDSLRDRTVIVLNFSRLVELTMTRPDEPRKTTEELLRLVWQHDLAGQLQETLRAELVNCRMGGEDLGALERQVLPPAARELWAQFEGLPVVAVVDGAQLHAGTSSDAHWWAIDQSLVQWREAGRTLTELEELKARLVEIEGVGHDSADVEHGTVLPNDGRSVQLLEEILQTLRIGLPSCAPESHDTAAIGDAAASRIADLEAELAVASEQLDMSERQLREARTAMREQEQELDALRATADQLLEELQALQDEGERELRDATMAVNERTEALARIQMALDEAVEMRVQERASAASVIHAEVQRRRQAEAETKGHLLEVERLTLAAEEAERRIAELTGTLERASEDEESKRRLYALEAELRAVRLQLDSEVAARCGLESSLRQSIIAETELRHTLVAVTRNYHRAQNVVSEVLASRSWRLTRPLRRQRRAGQER